MAKKKKKQQHAAPRLPLAQRHVGYLKHHQRNVLAQQQFAAAQDALQRSVDYARRMAPNPYIR